MILATDWLAFHADRTPERLAAIDQHTGRRVTYGEMHERSGRLAAWLREEWGVQPGDRLAILGKNSVAYFEFEFACIKLGAMMLPLNWRLAEPELLFILNDAEARGIVYDSEFAERIPPLTAASTATHTLRLDIPGFPADDGAPEFEQAIAEAPGVVEMNPHTTLDEPMTIMYTAGTTGRPKGVLITHQMTLYNAINISNPTGLNHDSVFYAVLPTFHTGGLNLYANPVFYLGGVNIIARSFDAALTLKTLSDPAIGVTHFFGVPAIYLFLSQEPGFDSADLSRIHSWGGGGSPMPVALIGTYAARGIIVQMGFGMTETSPTVFLCDKRRALTKPASVGKPLMYTRVRVVNEAFEDVTPGTIGEVIIGGPNITPGYWKRPDANEASFITDEDGVRWIRSGDAGTVDDEGCIYVVDRYKDMYLSGGENVYPAEVEQVLFQLPEVADAAVIGIPDERWGECGLAILVLKPGCAAEPDAVIAYCRANLAKYKTPKAVVFVDALPRNVAGKVLKRELRERFAPK